MKYTLFILAVAQIFQAATIVSIVYVNGIQNEAVVRQARQIDCLEQGRVWVLDEFCKEPNNRP